MSKFRNLSVPIPSVEGVVPPLQKFLGQVDSRSAMLRLSGSRGDWCVRTDEDGVAYALWSVTPLGAWSWEVVDSPAAGAGDAAPAQSSAYYRRARTVGDSNGTDDTAAVQAVFAEGAGEIVFRKGTTSIIDANSTTGMLSPLSNTRVIIEEGATVKVKTNALSLSYLFQVSGVSNVSIEGMGTLLGDALLHTGSTGQYGHLINITNSSDVRVSGPLKLTHAWGDGVYIGGGVIAACNDILIDGVVFDDCRREGISPFWVDGCTIRDCRIVDIASTAYVPGGPGSGIDVEPNDGQFVNNLTIENNYIAGTAGNGIYISTLPAGGVVPYTTNVVIRDNNIIGCGIAAGGALTASGPSGFTNGIYVRDVDDPIIENNVVLNSGFVGDTGFVSTGIKTNLCDRPVIKGNTVSGAKGAGILVTGGTTPEIVGNSVRNNGQRGISTGVAGAVIRGNQVFDNNQAGGSSEHHVSASGDGCVVEGNVFRGVNGNSWVRISAGADNLVARNTGIGVAPTNKVSDSGTGTIFSGNVRKDTGVYELWTVSDQADPAVAAHAATAKTTPVDNDEFLLVDSAASNVRKKTLWSNIKTTLAAWLGILPSGTTIAIHNQADQTTNFEKVQLDASSNVFRLLSTAGGTGTQRDFQWGVGTVNYLKTSTSAAAKFLFNVASSTAGIVATQVSAALSAASGSQTALKLAVTSTQTGTGGYTALDVDVTETSVGSGVKKLADLKVGGVSKFSVDNTGVVTAIAGGIAGTVPVFAAVPATASSTGTYGQIARDASFVYFCTAANTWVRAALATW